MRKMKVEEIVREYLINHGFDGLYAPNECACSLKDGLFPCGSEGTERCEAGYFIPKDDPDFDQEFDYMIGPARVAKEKNGKS